MEGIQVTKPQPKRQDLNEWKAHFVQKGIKTFIVKDSYRFILWRERLPTDDKVMVVRKGCKILNSVT